MPESMTDERLAEIREVLRTIIPNSVVTTILRHDGSTNRLLGTDLLALDERLRRAEALLSDIAVDVTASWRVVDPRSKYCEVQFNQRDVEELRPYLKEAPNA